MSKVIWSLLHYGEQLTCGNDKMSMKKLWHVILSSWLQSEIVISNDIEMIGDKPEQKSAYFHLPTVEILWDFATIEIRLTQTAQKTAWGFL